MKKRIIKVITMAIMSACLNHSMVVYANDKSDSVEKTFEKSMYITAKSGLNVRKCDNIESEKVTAYPYGTEIQTIGFTENGWYIINDGKNTLYMCGDYLSENKPEKIENDSVKSTTSTLLGNFKLTAYCSCSKCCGKWAGSPTASGTNPVEGRTVAMGGVNFGTKLNINGNVYTVEDRGTPYGHVDIYMSDHDACNNFGVQYSDVYIVE